MILKIEKKYKVLIRFYKDFLILNKFYEEFLSGGGSNTLTF